MDTNTQLINPIISDDKNKCISNDANEYVSDEKLFASSDKFLKKNVEVYKQLAK